MGIHDRAYRWGERFGVDHPAASTFFSVLFFVSIAAVYAARALNLISDVGPLTHAIAMFAVIVAATFLGWWSYVALKRDFQMSPVERRIARIASLASGTAALALYGDGVFPKPALFVMCVYAASFLTLTAPMLIVGYMRNRRLSPEKRLALGRKGMTSLFGGRVVPPE